MKQPPSNMQDAHTRLQHLYSIRSENTLCNDCHSINPTWANITYGVLLCTCCAGRHRENVQYRVRSLLLDRISEDDMRRMVMGGNGMFGDGDGMSRYRESEWYVNELTERVRGSMKNVSNDGMKNTNERNVRDGVKDISNGNGVKNTISVKNEKNTNERNVCDSMKSVKDTISVKNTSERNVVDGIGCRRTTKLGSKSIEEIREKRKKERSEKERMAGKKVITVRRSAPANTSKKETVTASTAVTDKKETVTASAAHTVTHIALERGTGMYTYKGSAEDVGLLDTKQEERHGNEYNYGNIKFYKAEKEKSVVKKVADSGKSVVESIISKFSK